MKKIYLFLFVLGVVFTAVAQDEKPNVDVKGGTAEIDGAIDEWEAVEAIPFEVPFQTEAADVGAAYWKAMWDDDAIYVLVNVAEDDSHFPGWAAGLAGWQADKPEVYFDVNNVLNDGKGAKDNAGHRQFSPDFQEEEYDTKVEWDDGSLAYYVTLAGDGGYIIEYQVNYSGLVDADGAEMDAYALMDLEEKVGFDITIIDLDEGEDARQRLNWANTGSIDESWNNMDGCGTITIVEGGVGVKDLSNAIKVYPNPAVDVLTVNQTFDRLVVTNIVGQEVKSINTPSHRVNVSDLSRGVYVIKAYNNNELEGTARFSKR
jgi:hypothetical protein